MTAGGTSAIARLTLLVTLALTFGCYDSSDYIVTPERADRILSVSSADGRTSLPADGFSHLTLVIQISPEATSDRRAVVVRTSAGKLLGGAAYESDDVTAVRKLVPDATGQGFLELVSSNTHIGAVTVTAEVAAVGGLTSRALTIQFTPPDATDVIWFTQRPTSAPADGATFTTFSVQISTSLPVTSEIEFSVSSDDLAPSDLTPAVTGYGASLTIKSPAEPRSGVRVTASVNSIGTETFIDFVPALPDTLSLTATPAVVTVAGPDTSELSVTFSRTPGTVTTGTVFSFEVRQKGGKLVFADSVAWDGASSTVTTDFTPTATTAIGTATATAYVSGSKASSTASISVLP